MVFARFVRKRREMKFRECIERGGLAVLCFEHGDRQVATEMGSGSAEEAEEAYFRCIGVFKFIEKSLRLI